ncbi:mediator of DNA damage checkpoint protein 1 [Silurus asotus]|uniref:Mediator of DNA damage checkpoint protein 1 n=1 Tax=Silurus asotus TaxID=30991 RepID=A0AAD5APB0_SILAS|nr:mediator of DNA damage checkpoint protein 1 [Silurus asotus]
MDATQQIEDSFFGEEDNSDHEHDLEEGRRQRKPLALLKVLKNNHVPETEVPLYQGENVLGRDPTSCSVPIEARSISGRHAVISVSTFGANDPRGHNEATEALLWDLGSLNGTRKGRLKLTPHVRYALTEGDGVVLADLPCQYVVLNNAERSTVTFAADGGRGKAKGQTSGCSGSKGVENGSKKNNALPPVPVWPDEAKSPSSTTPKKPERTLVPESESDSDGEKHTRRDRRRIVDSDSASSDFSSPTCSTFLTPANKVIPESEDESSITPSPALQGRLVKNENDPEVSSDSPKPDPLLFDIDSDSDVEDEDVEAAKVTPGTEAAPASGAGAKNPVGLHMDSDTDVEEDVMEKDRKDPEVLAAPVKQDSVNPAALNMDSDTDVEEDELVKTDTMEKKETASSGQFHLESDTDVEEDVMEKDKNDPKSLEAPVVQDLVNPAALNMDSDTDVEEDEPVKTDTTDKKETANSGQFHLESDTDVEDEDVPHIQDSRPKPNHVAELNMNSDTDVEEEEVKGTGKAKEPPSDDTKDGKDGRILGHQLDSDTDVEDDVTEIRTPAAAKETGSSQTRSDIQNASERSTDARHESPVQAQHTAETLQEEFRLDSDTDVEEDEEKTEEKEQKSATKAAAVHIVHSSTPRGAGLSDEMEMEAFLSPAQLFKRPVLPSLLHPSASPGALGHSDDEFAVAETQSFVCDAAQADATLDETPLSPVSVESRRSDGASSFQLGLSDSSHQVPEAREHNREPAEDDWQLQATQLYAMKNSEVSTKAGQTQPDLDATQAYTDVTEIDEEEDVGKKEEKGEQDTHTAEKVLIKHGAWKDENSGVVASEPERATEEDEAMRVDSHLSTADTLLIVRSPRQEEQTQAGVFLAAQSKKAQEETVEHGSRDEELQETERARNESAELENDEGRAKKEKSEVIRVGPEEEPLQIDDLAQVAVAGTLPMCEEENEEDEEQPIETSSNRGTHSAKVDLAYVAVAETLPMCEDEDVEDEDEEQPIETSSNRGTHSAKVDLAYVAVAETLPMCEEEEEEELIEPSSRRPKQPAKVESTQPLELDNLTHVAVARTLPMSEVEEGEDEDQLAEPSSSRPMQPAEVESTQPLELEDLTHVATAETLPMCKEEEQIKPSRRPCRRRPLAGAVQKQSIKSDQEDKEGQEGEQKSEATSRRSSMRRIGAKAKPVESRATIPETLPKNEEEEEQEEKGRSETKPSRKSSRRKTTSKPESTQPLKPETVKMDEEEGEQDSKRCLRGKGRAASGKGKPVGKKGKQEKGEQDSGSEVDEDRGNKGRRRKDLRQKSKDDDEARIAESEEIEHLKRQEEEEERKILQRKKEEEEARERKEREESMRLEKERKEREEREKREQEEKDRLKKERIEREKKEKEEEEMKAREEKERVERERQLEKERREQEEKGRQERERMEREEKESEEKEKLEKEKRERQELEEELEREQKKREEERIAREKRESEEREQQEKEMREEKEKQEKEMEQTEKEKESKGNEKGMEKEERHAPGKRKTWLGRKGKKSIKGEEQKLEEGTEERMQTDQDFSEKQKQEDKEVSGKKREDEQAESDAKPRRGRRTTRKSVAPPADVEDEGGPAKRTRSRSNSSNSVCSEQSTQDSLNEGRRRWGRRKTAEEVNEKSSVSGRRACTAPSREREDTKQAARSRSESRSSERSSSSVGTRSQGRGGKRRKTIKAEEQDEKEVEVGKQSAAVGRGRGRGRARGGKSPGPNVIKAETAGEPEEPKPEVPAVSKDSVMSPSSSRGRKRGTDVLVLTPEFPQPTPKTPRRSITGPTHKVLFTGVVDEDGEKVVTRLGGGLAKGVGDMTHLVTDKVRRTVKFLCAVARGVPIVTPDWLKKCGKAGSFLSPNGFLVKDVEQEKRFNFSLQDALRAASSQTLLQGYEIHVTPSVKPEPAQMKEIITCCGARFLPKMPSAHKAQTIVVVSCEEDRALCERARSLALPVVSAEFLLTGILQQKADVQTHALSLSPAAAAQTKPAARRRGK